MEELVTVLQRTLSTDPGEGPPYARLARAIVRALEDGHLLAGDRLPTQRELAKALGFAVPTVTRAYRTANERGLIESTVGRGTFVAGVPDLRDAAAASRGRSDMAVNGPVKAEQEQLLRTTLRALSADPRIDPLLAYGPDIGAEAHRRLATGWLARRGLEAAPGDVALTQGGQHALVLALAATMHAGDRLAVEEVTYPGVRSAAQLLGLPLVPVAMDAGGLQPQALAELCASPERPRAVCVSPTAQNPTATTLTAARRRQLAEVAREHDLLIVEDDVFGLLGDPALPTLAALAGERTMHLTSFSKTLSPGLRCGILTGPPAFMRRVGHLIRATVFNAAPLTTAVTMRWIQDGTADRVLSRQREEALRRAESTRRKLGASGAVRAIRTAALHAWVELEHPWTATEAVQAAAAAGVDISPTVFFNMRSDADPAAVRLCLGNARDAPALERALDLLCEVWEDNPRWSSGTRV